MPERVPVEIKLHQKSRVMEIAFADGRGFRLSYEFLRVYSPSAEVRGHGPGQEVLQSGKREVEIRTLEPVGSYAVQPVFSDGHSTGIYSWEYLYDLVNARSGSGASTSQSSRKLALLEISRRSL
jgi:DUF971 family protein